MKNIFSVFFISFLLILVLAISVEACWCRKDPEETNTPKKLIKNVLKSFRSSSLVFIGKATEQTGEHLKFEVQQSWKGNDSKEIYFTSGNYVDWSKSNSNKEGFIDSCAFYFKLGESYLIFAYFENGNFEAYKCGRTQILETASKDIEVLNSLRKDK